MLPIDGNPHKSMALIAHPGKVWTCQSLCFLKAGLHDHMYKKFASHFLCEHRM